MRSLIGLVLAASIMAACGGQSAEPTDGAGEPTDGAAGGEAISIIDFGYEPATLTVQAGQGITWTNDGAVPHTVTFDEGPDSSTLQPDATFEHTFDAPGEYDYVCTIHPAMRGVVNVGP